MKTRFATRGVIDTPELKLFAGMHGARWYAKLSSGRNPAGGLRGNAPRELLPHRYGRGRNAILALVAVILLGTAFGSF